MAQNGLISRNVRVHPRAPKKGYRVRIYNIYGIPFAEERGWYQVSLREDQFRILRSIRNEPDNPDSKPVFDICTDEERQVIQREEDRAKMPQEAQTSVVDLNRADTDSRYLEDRSRGRASADLTTADLRRIDSQDEQADVRDLAPPVPPPAAGAIDGAPPKPRRGRPPKVKTAQA